MKKAFSYRTPVFSAALMAIMLVTPFWVVSKATAASTPATQAPTTDSASAAAPAVAAKPLVSADHPTADSVTAGQLTASHAVLKYKKDHIDVFLSIKNAGNIDETIVGAGTPWTDGDVVEVKKDKDGKETESPVSIPLPADKTTDLADDAIWLRVKDIKHEPKETDIMPFDIYTRRSPNLSLKIAVGKGGSGSLMDWLKK